MINFLKRKPLTEQRKKLNKLTKKAIEIRRKKGAFNLSINNILINEIYKTKKHQIFKSLREWEKDGFILKENEKPFLIWGEHHEENTAKDVEIDTINWLFPTAYIYSNAQIERH